MIASYMILSVHALLLIPNFTLLSRTQMKFVNKPTRCYYISMVSGLFIELGIPPGIPKAKLLVFESSLVFESTVVFESVHGLLNRLCGENS